MSSSSNVYRIKLTLSHACMHMHSLLTAVGMSAVYIVKTHNVETSTLAICVSFSGMHPQPKGKYSQNLNKSTTNEIWT